MICSRCERVESFSSLVGRARKKTEKSLAPRANGNTQTHLRNRFSTYPPSLLITAQAQTLKAAATNPRPPFPLAGQTTPNHKPQLAFRVACTPCCARPGERRRRPQAAAHRRGGGPSLSRRAHPALCARARSRARTTTRPEATSRACAFRTPAPLPRCSCASRRFTR